MLLLPVNGLLPVGLPSSVTFGDSFPRGGGLFAGSKTSPRGFYTVGRSFLFYCLIALTTLFRSRSSSQTILTGWL